MTDLDLLRVQLRKTQELLRDAIKRNKFLEERLVRLVAKRLRERGLAK